MTELNTKHHTLIQALLSRGPLTEDQFHRMFSDHRRKPRCLSCGAAEINMTVKFIMELSITFRKKNLSWERLIQLRRLLFYKAIDKNYDSEIFVIWRMLHHGNNWYTQWPHCSIWGSTVHEICTFQGLEWHPRIRNERHHFIYNDLPRFIMDSYEECRDPPRLHLLDKFDTGGLGSCLKRYSDPTFFKRASAIPDEANGGKVQRDRKAQRSKKKKGS